MDWGHAAIMALSFVVGAFVRRIQGVQTSPLPRWQRLGLLLAAIVGGAIFSRFPFVLTSLENLQNPWIWFADGRTVTWGLAGGYLSVELAKLSLGVRTKTGDSFAAPVAAAIAIGRLGCFRAGCCYGLPTALPWAVDFGDGVGRHPTQLYEFAFHTLACLLLLWMGKHGWFARQRIKLYLIAYMLYRFLTEWLRPEPVLAAGLTFYQWSVLCFALALIAQYIYDARKFAREEAPVTSRE